MPVVGIPLPLISYGLCNLWITIASFGIFQNIIMHCR
jgi:cell division protein FtsW (lipid II flippase)